MVDKYLLDAALSTSFLRSGLQEAYRKGVLDQWRDVVRDEEVSGVISRRDILKFFIQGDGDFTIPGDEDVSKANALGEYLGGLAANLRAVVTADVAGRSRAKSIREVLPATRLRVWYTMQRVEERSALAETVRLHKGSWREAIESVVGENSEALSEPTLGYFDELLRGP